jgi:adenosine deaminase
MNLDYQSMPKVELHSHLDCTLSYAAVSQLSPGITRDEYRRLYVAPARCESLADYLTYTRNGVALLQSRAALELAVSDLFDQLVEDRVIYSELRYAPFLHTARGLAVREVVKIVAAACDRAAARTGVDCRIILCTLRHFSAEQSLATVQLISEFKGSRVAAFDIAGDEAGFPADAHEAAFRYAIEQGIHRTAHAGEARGADSVWETLEKFQPARIGHGVRSIEDPALIQTLRDKRIHLEICPCSNFQTGVVSALSEHPVARLYDAGLSLSISTDTRGITDTTLKSEYAVLTEQFGWGREHFLACNRHAVEAAFLPAGPKAALRRKLDDYAGGH